MAAEHLREYHRQWREANRDKCRAYSKAAYDRNKEAINRKRKAQKAANRETSNANAREYYQQHKKRILAKQRAQYRLKHPAKPKTVKPVKPPKPQYTKEQKAYIQRARQVFGKEWRQHITEADIESIVTDAAKYGRKAP